MSDIAGNISYLRSTIPDSVKLIAVSKTRPVADIVEAYNTGQRCFGENRVQELLTKKDKLPEDIEWHLIGHLQSNKVKTVVPFISLIHSVDSFRLLSVINAEALRISRVVDCLLQVHIAREETKFGFNQAELTETVTSAGFESLKNVRVCGLMGMATFTSSIEQVRQEFVYLVDSFKTLKNGHFANRPYFKEISMGMSGDYKIAIEEGSTMIRVGSMIFGVRNTH